MGCLFCDIVTGRIPSKRLHEDETCVAFEDIHPQAPSHLLVVPRQHLARVSDLTAAHEGMMGHLVRVAGDLALARGQGSYRLVLNCGEEAGQSVFHLHLHLLAGRRMGWPPG
jgi:histidine triad (HIT) family protein